MIYLFIFFRQNIGPMINLKRKKDKIGAIEIWKYQETKKNVWASKWNGPV